jgi:glycosyltransferase involved in cell wall biosynthesis
MKKQHKPTIGFMTHDWAWGTEPLEPNGCCYYRCTLPSNELNKRGWFTAVGFPGYGTDKGFGMLMSDGRSVHGWDIIVFKLLMQREVLEKMPLAQAMGQKLVVDVDDWFDGLAETNKAFQATDPKKNPDNNREIYAQIIMQADAVITSTPFLFDYYAKKRDNVFMVRNGIDSDRYNKRSVRYPKKSNIGWVGATHWRSNDLEQLSGFMDDYLKSRNTTFHHSGHAPSAPSVHDLLKIDKKRFTHSSMAPISLYPRLFSHMDIGTIPLNNIQFNHAKSFIKGLEYAAAGVPFITSYSPEYEFLVNQGIGRMAKTDEEWVYHLDELMNHQMRIDEMNENRELLKKFDMNARGDDWDATMRVILEKI